MNLGTQQVHNSWWSFLCIVWVVNAFWILSSPGEIFWREHYFILNSLLWDLDALFCHPNSTLDNSSILKNVIQPVVWHVGMIVVASDFVFAVCQTPASPDLGAWIHHSRCPEKPPSESNGEIPQGVGLCWGPGGALKSPVPVWEASLAPQVQGQSLLASS